MALICLTNFNIILNISIFKTNNFAKKQNQITMKKTILLLIALLSISYPISAFTPVASDTNKTDSSGKKTGFWKEKDKQIDFYGNYQNDKKEGLWTGYYTNGAISNMDEYKN